MTQKAILISLLDDELKAIEIKLSLCNSSIGALSSLVKNQSSADNIEYTTLMSLIDAQSDFVKHSESKKLIRREINKLNGSDDE